jgi:hypothetical protein
MHCHGASATKNLQHLNQKWERLLFSTGGAINLQKSFWILMSWYWDKGKSILLTPQISSDTLTLTEGYNVEEDITVPRLSPYNNYRTLGVYISPSGSSEPASQILTEKSKDYAKHIAGSNLSKEEVLWSFLLYFIPRISFPFQF